MVKHIVFLKLKPEALGRTAADNALEAKRRLEALNGVVPGLLHLEVGVDFSRGEASADLALYSEFPNRAALDAYQSHPAHVEAAKFVGQVRESRWVVDYEG